MKTRCLPCLPLLALSFSLLAADPLTDALQKGLVDEEVNRDLSAAVRAYQSAVTQYDDQRKPAATALFRLGESYRKLGKTNEAVAAYQRILREFPAETTLAKLSRENLATLGITPPTAEPPTSPAGTTAPRPADPADVASLGEEIKLVELEILATQKRLENGKATTDELRQPKRDLLRLQRQLPANAANERQVALIQEAIGLAEDELKEVKARIQVGVAPPLDEIPVRRTLLGLQRELRAAQAAPANGTPSPGGATVALPAVSEEQAEIARLREMLKNSPDLLNAPGPGDLTPLQSAASKGQIAVVQFLLDHGADVNHAGNDKASLTALHYAALNGHKGVAELLLARGADVNAGARSNVTPLQLAVAGGHRAVVQVLLAAKPDVNATVASGRSFKGRPENYMTALHLAAQKGSRPMVEALLAAGAEVDKPQSGGWRATPLITACDGGSTEIVELLLEAKANVNARNSTGGTALHHAVSSNRPDLIALLLARGANPDAATDEGYTPSHTAAFSHEADMVAALLKAKPALNRLTKEGWAPLHLALGARKQDEGGDPQIIELFLEAGAEVNLASGGTAMTPLHLAVNRGSVELVKLILGHQPKLEVMTDQGFTPLQQALLNERLEIAQALLAAGANPNVACPTDQGNRPLHWAARSGNAAAVELLLKYKADVNGVNYAMQTPLSTVLPSAAQPRGRRPGGEAVQYDKVIELLRQAGADESFHLRDTISARRPNGQVTIMFRREGSDVNRYTLLETIAMLYGVSDGAREARPSGWDFPDFARAAILRRVESGVRTIPVDLAAILASKDCGRDQPLEWGDAVELPEADHVVGQPWAGLPSEALETLGRCLSRTVTVSLKGETKSIALVVTNGPSFKAQTHQFQQTPATLTFAPSKDAFWLKGAVDASRLVRTSSDLTRVKVKRMDPNIGQLQTMVFNLAAPTAAPRNAPRGGRGGAVPQAGFVPLVSSVPTPIQTGGFEGGYSTFFDAGMGEDQPRANQTTAPLWLQDGDVIEIPEKPSASAAANDAANAVRVIGEVNQPGPVKLEPGK